MDAEEVYGEGQKLFVEGKYDESVDAFTKAINAGEKSELIFLSRGVACFKSNKLDDAIRDFEKVIEMNDRNYRAYFYRGTTRMYKENYKEAIEDFDRTIEFRPDFGAAFFARGTAYFQLGNEEEGSRSINTAISCSESSLQWVTDHYGMFRTQFDRALAFMTDGNAPTMYLDDDQMKKLKDLLEEDKK